MKIYLNEIKETEKRLAFDEKEAWLDHAVIATDESLPEETLRPAGLKPMVVPARSIEAIFQLRKADTLYMVTGALRTHVHLLCSRCADVFPFEINSRFSTAYCKDPVLAGVGHLEAVKGQDPKDPNPQMKPAGRQFGFARSQRKINDYEDTMRNESSDDLDLNYIAEDHLDLGLIVTEQLRFRLPLQPLCKEDCKGICPHCGTNLNEGTCACSKIKKASPFASLSTFRTKGNR